MAICIARHGETAWNHSGTLQGWTDVPMNEQGRRQSEEMALALASEGFKVVWSSPLIRALESARIIADRLGLAAPRCHEGLKERNFGIIQGVPKAELAELNPLLLQQIVMRNPAADFEGGETIDEFAERVLHAVADIGTQCPHQQVLVITHGWAMDVVMREVQGLPRTAMLSTKPRNTERLWVEAEEGAIVARI